MPPTGAKSVHAALQAQPLLKMMQLIGALSGGRTVTQVALNWLMAKGAAFLLLLNATNTLQAGCTT
jgi:aryl-alcohol dehydrogenase-like predicted oxidoreductase